MLIEWNPIERQRKCLGINDGIVCKNVGRLEEIHKEGKGSHRPVVPDRRSEKLTDTGIVRYQN